MSDGKPPGKPGRPKSPAPLVPVSGMIPEATYARLCAQATQQRVSLSKLVRVLLNGAVTKPEGGK